MRALIIPLLLLLVQACSPQAAEQGPAPAPAQASAHPVSGLPVIPLTVRPADGRAHTVRVELAKTDADQERGLMFRTAMGADEGMLFPTEQAMVRSFWMKNTVIPLDLIFVGADHRVTNVAAMAVPYSEAPIWSTAPVIAVLELNGGRAAQLGIVAGTRIEW